VCDTPKASYPGLSYTGDSCVLPYQGQLLWPIQHSSFLCVISPRPITLAYPTQAILCVTPPRPVTLAYPTQLIPVCDPTKASRCGLSYVGLSYTGLPCVYPPRVHRCGPCAERLPLFAIVLATQAPESEEGGSG
jgi:hypothetical protein